MGGKGSLILVIGFSFIFMIAGRNFNNMATSTIDNYDKYYLKTQCRYFANSGVNIINSKLWKNAALVDQTYTFTFEGGTIVDSLVTIDAVKNIKKIVSTGTITLADGTTYSSTTKVIVQPSLFSKFAYFSNSEGGTIYWTTKDTVFGPMHTNDNLNVSGNPVFEGDVTIGGSLKKANGSSDHPQFLSDFQTNVSITIPDTGVSHVARYATGGASFTGHSLVYFEFRGDSVRYRYNTTSSWTYKLASTFTPNGVIYFQNAEVHISGNVKGRYSLATDYTTTSTNLGSFYIDNDITYNTNPQTNSTSTDMLGLLAYNNVWITDNTANNSNVNIQAAIYCQKGSFGAQNYDTRSSAGFINLYGGITQKTRGAVGTIGSGGSIATGFSKRYRYDDRLLSTYPPFYPGCGSYEIVSWFE
jgi:hypothetical protein